jgi:hypothetical protein
MLVLGGLLSVHGQVAPKQLVPVRATVADVSDYRTTEDAGGRCMVGLRFTGDAAAEAMDILRINLKTAQDDLNRDLIQNATQPNMEFLDGRRKGLVRSSVALRNPSRNATTIKLLEGEVELFNPTVANGGLAIIKDFFKLPPTPMQHPSLVKNDIEVIYITKALFDTRKAEFQAQHQFLRGQWPYQQAACVFLTDPNRLMASFEVQQPDGTTLGGGRNSIDAEFLGEQTRVLRLRAVPPAGSVLKITLKVPAAIRAYPFKLEKIQLP